MKNKIFSYLQAIGKAFMLPIALLPVAGLFLGIGASFTNPTNISIYHLEGILGTVVNGQVIEPTLLYNILSIMAGAGDIIFGNLPLLFAIAVSLALAKEEKAVAALSGAVFFLVMHKSINVLLSISDKLVSPDMMNAAGQTVALGIQSLQMGVFGGIIAGMVVAALHNKYYTIKFPDSMAFFSGTRFIPIISAIVAIISGGILFFVWPFIQQGIEALGGLVLSSGYFGTFIYGVIERSLIPFGLHHVFYLPFWQTGVGGELVISGKTILGAQNIFFAELADPSWKGLFTIEHVRFMSGKFPFMIFGLPGAALAMYHTANSSKKKIAAGLLASAAFTAFLTGITEPIEFSFLFVAPFLYGIHAVLAGFSFMLMHIFNIPIGMTFSGGFIDFFLFGILQGNDKTNWIRMIPIGVVYFVIYYFLFRFLITKFDLKTPGREDDSEEMKLYTKKDVQNKGKASATSDVERAAKIVEGLGGKDNIVNVDCCITKLRVQVKDSSIVNDGILKSTGALGVIRAGEGVQVAYGPKVVTYKSDVDKYLGRK